MNISFVTVLNACSFDGFHLEMWWTKVTVPFISCQSSAFVFVPIDDAQFQSDWFYLNKR